MHAPDPTDPAASLTEYPFTCSGSHQARSSTWQSQGLFSRTPTCPGAHPQRPTKPYDGPEFIYGGDKPSLQRVYRRHSSVRQAWLPKDTPTLKWAVVLAATRLPYTP